MSVNLCVQFYVIAAADSERVTELARTESEASDHMFYGKGPNRQEGWDRAVAAMMRTCRELAVEQHRFALPHGDTCCSEIGDHVREARKLEFDLYGVLSPPQLQAFRDALAAVVADRGEKTWIKSLPESRDMAKTAAQFLAMLRQVLDRAGADHYLVIRYEDGIWDAADEPADEPAELELEDDGLEDRLARIDRAVSDGRVTERERAALVRAVKRVPKSADQTAALLDLAEMLHQIEAKLSSN